MQVLMISGKSASGKDEFARLLKEKLESRGKTVLTIHFGDAVKDMLTRYYKWDGNKDTTGRAMLQHLGNSRFTRSYSACKSYYHFKSYQLYALFLDTSILTSISAELTMHSSRISLTLSAYSLGVSMISSSCI